MENGESSSQLSTSFSIPRGGPIFLPDLVSPLIRVSTFECDVFLELESLKAELADFDDNNDEEEDISVEELKIYSEEELVSEAMKIAFEDDEAGPSSDLMENPCNSRAADDDGILDLDTSTSFGSSNGFSCEKSHDGVANGANLMKNEGTTNAKPLLTYKRRKKINQDGVENDPNLKKMERGEAKDSSKKRIAKETSLEVVENGSNLKKRKRRANGEENCKKRMKKDTSLKEIENCANLKEGKRRVEVKAKSKTTRKKELVVHDKDKAIDETYLMKVEHLAKIRQKQEQDKASVKLHSFNFNHGKDSNAVLASGNIETLKYLESFSCPFKGKCSLTGKRGPIQFPEVVLCVEVYHNKQSWKKTQEFLVLGSQTLTELRDRIRCVTDVLMQKAGEYDPSGYFLIEEVFCNDMRDPSAINYSQPIFDWLKDSKEEALAKWNCILSGIGKNRKVLLDDKPVSRLPNFRSADMQKARFCDLDFRLGAGYLYCHQGDCKHIIVIRDMRLIHPEDVQNRAAYPLLLYQAKTILKKCSVCRIYRANKVTVDDKLAGENPCYFCDNCYYLLHYSADGTLLYDRFSVYEYLQDYC